MNIGLKERYMKENKKGRIIALVANTTWNIYNFRLNLIEKFLGEGFKVIVIAPVDEYLICHNGRTRHLVPVAHRRLDGDGVVRHIHRRNRRRNCGNLYPQAFDLDAAGACRFSRERS